MDLWLAVCRFAYRRIRHRPGPMPVGVPGNRDPQAPCVSYSPRPRLARDWANCNSDGHYLCAECCHRKICDGCDAIAEPGADLCETCQTLEAQFATRSPWS